MKFTLEVKHNEDTNEYYIELPEEALEKSGFKFGDRLKWTDNGDGSWSLTKMEDDLKYYVVDVLSSFRNRFVVKARSLDHAFDEVTCRSDDPEFAEFSQKHIGCEIIDGIEVSEEELLAIHKRDNDYLASWPDDVVFEKLTNTIKYDD